MFSVVEIMDDNTYGEEFYYGSDRSDAMYMQRSKLEDEGIRTDVLERKKLSDMYGVPVEGYAWVMVSEMELEEVA